MENQSLNNLIDIVPTVLWIILAGVVFIMLRRTIENNVLPRLTGAKGPGFEFSFAAAANQLDEAIARSNVTVSQGDRRGALGRAERHINILQGTRILWVDDRPEDNRRERKLLHSLGITIDLAVDTNEALARLARAEYDLVITDMERDGDDKAGSDLIMRMRGKGVYRWTIIYLRNLNPALGTPAWAFAITNRPDQLLHYVMDIMERERS
jgi:CheY-like chemotaxis protein